MSATQAETIVTGVDFVSVPTRDLARAVVFLRAPRAGGLRACGRANGLA